MSEYLDWFCQYLARVFAFDPETPLLFTQMQFWVFFALVFGGFCLFGTFQKRLLLRNAYLLFISLFFYYKTSGMFVGLLMVVTCSDYLIARGIYHFSSADKDSFCKRILPNLLLALSVCFDLSLLCYFKYTYFLTDVINQVLGTDYEVTNVLAQAGNEIVGSPVWSVDHIILPVGISFYLFQIISYTTDVYRGLIRPVTNILDFGFYVSFFPQLVAGPIVKASDFIPQLYRPFHLSRMQFGIAVFWMLNGLVKKIVLSDYLAVNYIDRVFANPSLFSGFENLSALFAYSLQIYADFSGYTDIAIGLSLLMGFYLPANFRSPYQATNCQNLWKRWHISLSSWLQTYLYIPLGGNRGLLFGTGLFRWCSMERQKTIFANINSMATMLLGGLWHGASLNFIVWGGLHGLGMGVYRLWKDWGWGIRACWLGLIYLALAALCWYDPQPLWNVLLVFFVLVPALTWCRAGSILLTFIFVTFTWLFFRSGSNLPPAEANEIAWNTASQMIHQIGSPWTVSPLPVIEAYWKVFALFSLGLCIHWLPMNWKRRYRICFAKLPLPIMALIVVMTVFVVFQFVSAEMHPFIYFQF